MYYKMNEDLLNAKQFVIVQQVNCKGVMGAGLAKQIKTKYPKVYANYKALCDKHKSCSKELLGRAQCVVTDEHVVINIFAQDSYGRTKCHTDLDAFSSCCKRLNSWCKQHKVTAIAMPYGIGAGLAGGDWGAIKHVIASTLEVDIYFYKKA